MDNPNLASSPRVRFRKKLPSNFFQDLAGVPRPGPSSTRLPQFIRPSQIEPLASFDAGPGWLGPRASGFSSNANALPGCTFQRFRKPKSCLKQLETTVVCDQSNNIRLLVEAIRHWQTTRLFWLLVFACTCAGLALKLLDWPVYHHQLSILESSPNLSDAVRDLLVRGHISVHLHNQLLQSGDPQNLRRQLASSMWSKWAFPETPLLTCALFWLVSLCLYRLVGFSRLFENKHLGTCRVLLSLSRMDWLWLGGLGWTLLVLFRNLFDWVTPSAHQLRFLRMLRNFALASTMLIKFLRADFEWTQASQKRETVFPSSSFCSEFRPFLAAPVFQSPRRRSALSFLGWSLVRNLWIGGGCWACALSWTLLNGTSAEVRDSLQFGFIKSVFFLLSLFLLMFDVSFCAVQMSLDRNCLEHLVNLSDFSFFLKLIWGLSRKHRLSLGN